MNNSHIKNLCLAAFFIALGFVLPFVTGSIPQIGNALLPMHIPVLLCGVVCGAKYGAAVGFVTPLLRSVIFGMPPIYPIGLAMALELATYAIVIGVLYNVLKGKPLQIYISLIVSMIAGRIVWGIATMALMGAAGGAFTMQMFLSGAFLTAVPGIVLQLILIPIVIVALRRAKLIDNYVKVEEN